jgi:hypothetical protein
MPNSVVICLRIAGHVKQSAKKGGGFSDPDAFAGVGVF